MIYINYLTTLTNIDKQFFKLEFKYNAYSLIRSIIKTRLIIGATINDTYTTITFKAKSIKQLTDIHTTNIPFLEQLTKNMATQLDFLIRYERHSLLGFNPRDIIIINDNIPIYVGNEFIVELEEDDSNEKMKICTPFSSDDFFLSPELLKIKQLPSMVHFKTAYFSLGILIIYELLGKKNEFYEDYLKENQNINMLKLFENHPIYQTKLYWFLSRCLNEDPSKRCILYV